MDQSSFRAGLEKIELPHLAIFATQPVLARLTDRGHVPEALRLAHLIASAVMNGESGRQT